MQLDEQEIQFKKRARRRLVGAIALVLLMVTILPMVLDDRSSNLQQPEIAISIPSQDGDDFTTDITPYIPEPVISDEDPEATSDSGTKQELPDENAALPKGETVATPAPIAKQSSPVAPVPVREEKPTAVVNPDKAPTYSVQIGVFSDAANVKQLEEKLKAKGLKSSTEKLQTPQGEKIRLRAGPFATRPLAEDALAGIKDAGLSGMIITNK